ncbi:MAG: LVIVD repeat-containing protein [Promethearchaeota archaeon]
MKRKFQMVIIYIPVVVLLSFRINSSISHVNDGEIVIQELGQITTTGHSYRVQVENDLAIIADSTEGLKIIDIKDPTNPKVIGQYQDGGFPFDIFIDQNLVYFADHGGGLKILNISDPSNPNLIGQFTDEDWSRDVHVNGNLAYVADWYDGIEILNISDPTNPVKISDIGTEVFSLCVTADLVFAAGEVLKIYNISDPWNPVEVGSYDIGNATNEIYVDGNLAYAAAWRKGLVILDFTDLSNITLLGQYVEEEIGSDGVFIKKNFAFVADYTNGLLLLNISDFSNITKIGHFHDGGEAHIVQVIDNLIYVADGSDGFEILQIEGLPEITMSTESATEITTTIEAITTDTNYSTFPSTSNSRIESFMSSTKAGKIPSFELIYCLIYFLVFSVVKDRKRGKK